MGDNRIALLDIGQLSEPVSKLIEAVSAAVGAVYEPTRIRRRAAAEADAATILAKAEIKIQGLQRRAAERLIAREIRRQENIEQITLAAINELPASVADEKVDTDWVVQFFENCQDITNEEMQLIWAKLLAGEVAQPGSFSPRTLATLKLMRPFEANLFERMRKYVWTRNDQFVPVLLDQIGPYASETATDLTFGELIHLQSIGVITLAGVGEIYLNQTSRMRYFGKEHQIIPPDESEGLSVGKCIFTEAGQELARIIDSHPDDRYRVGVIEYWRRRGCAVDEL